MNKHELADIAALAAARLAAGRHKYFSKSLDSPSVTKLASEIAFYGDTPLSPGIHEAPADSPVGHLDSAYAVLRRRPSTRVTLIFHHGNNERPFDTSRYAKNIFHHLFPDPDADLPCDLVAVRAPFHNESLGRYMTHMGKLANLAGMVAASAALIEKLVQKIRSETSNRVVICGVSLGGWVTNLHQALYESADATAPIFAGTALAETFLTSAYKKLTSPRALEDPDTIRAVLSFEDSFAQRRNGGVHPLLARFDRYVDFERQSKSYGRVPVSVIETGHVTGALSVDRLREHVLDVVDKAIDSSKGS